MKRYDPAAIEAKWQKIWAETGLYEARDDDPRPKAYIADMFPYPSGDGLHVGHVRNYTISDVMTRHKRMQGYNVLHPMGWDAFGLPAENYAIKMGVAPQDSIAANTVNFRQQVKSLGISIDWTREVDTSSPDFYCWTQWIFTVLFERGLAYQKESEQWWCEHDKTVLANEQVEAGKCWRCGNLVTKKLLKQWFFKITDYADELLDGLDGLDWPDRIKTMQRNWIGRSQGAELTFEAGGQALTVYTTRPDTLAGATFLVVAPEHPALDALTTDERRPKVQAYVEAAKRSSEIERQNTERTKTGVFTGSYAVNPLTGAQMPVWTADYVLSGYGTGAIMAVPAHDARDYEFAGAFDLPVVQVVAGESLPSVAAGPLQGSGQFDGLESDAAKRAVIAYAEEQGFGRGATNFKLRDWLISRQRYWGTPIPIVHCPTDGAVAVPADQLPVELPPIADYLPSGDGRSPLAKVIGWVNTTCPKCGGPAERETDTMDTFADSSWYFLRYADARNDQAAWSPEAAKAWLPVGTYIGGAEHAVLHLMYARFWTKALRDAGYLEFDEPFTALRNHGMILAPDGSKMSKSKGNVINPNQVVERYGADSVRLYELFVGPYDQAVAWSDERLSGMSRFVWRVWSLAQELLEAPSASAGVAPDGDQGDFEVKIDRLTHRTLKRVHDDLHDMGYNTAVSALMELINGLTAADAKARLVAPESAALRRRTLRLLTLMLAPFAPHLTEEIWHDLGEEGSVHVAAWPTYDPELIKDSVVTIVVQVNGKVRANLVADVASGDDELIEAAKADPNVAGYLAQGEIVKTIVVPRKLVNFVVR